jgi:dTMP kinase
MIHLQGISKQFGSKILFEGAEAHFGSRSRVALIGPNGAGKSTLIRELAVRLEPHTPVTRTREPGGSPVAERIRSILLEEPMDPWAELFLYEAARAEHLARTVRPALQAGHVVLCDRYADSSLAYQAHARGLPWKDVKQLNRTATRGLTPDLTVLLDIDPARGLERASDHNRFEAEGVAFQKKVRLGFLKSRRESPRRWLLLRVEGRSPQDLADAVYREALKRFGKRWKAAPRGQAQA